VCLLTPHTSLYQPYPGTGSKRILTKMPLVLDAQCFANVTDIRHTTSNIEVKAKASSYLVHTLISCLDDFFALLWPDPRPPNPQISKIISPTCTLHSKFLGHGAASSFTVGVNRGGTPYCCGCLLFVWYGGPAAALRSPTEASPAEGGGLSASKLASESNNHPPPL
jgi:hypothetical protein